MPTSFLAPLANFVQTTLNGAITDSATTITLSSTTNLTAPGYIVIDRQNSAGTDTPNSREVVSYTGLSGNDLTGCTRGADNSTARSHTDGAIVETMPTVGMFNNLATIVGTGLTNDGYLKAINSPVSIGRLESKTLSVNSQASIAELFTIRGVFSQATISTLLSLSGASINGIFNSGASGAVLTSVGANLLPIFAPAPSANTDGWTAATDTWTYASASTFTIAGVDRTSTFTKGTKLKFTNSSLKYAVVASSSFSTDTTVTIIVNTDYVIANAAISAASYSYQLNPQGFPASFAYTPSLSNITLGDGTLTFVYSVVGRLVYVRGLFVFGTTSSIGGEIGFGLPVASPAITGNNYYYCNVGIRDTGTTEFMGVGYLSSTTNLAIRVPNSSSTYVTPSSTSSSVPMTWANTDELKLSLIYEMG